LHYSKRHLWQLLRISFLAPDIIAAIAEGHQPPSLTGRRLLRVTDLPLDWAGQRRVLGFNQTQNSICIWWLQKWAPEIDAQFCRCARISNGLCSDERLVAASQAAEITPQ
jgi:hypothetical protein